MSRIVQYPAHVTLMCRNAPPMRILCVDGVSVRAATESALKICCEAGIERVEILSEMTESRFETGVPAAMLRCEQKVKERK